MSSLHPLFLTYPYFSILKDTRMLRSRPIGLIEEPFLKHYKRFEFCFKFTGLKTKEYDTNFDHYDRARRLCCKIT